MAALSLPLGIVHVGSHIDIDRAYGSLATYVSEHALAVDGPVRERYIAGRHDTSDEAVRRTEIGSTIFHTGGVRDLRGIAARVLSAGRRR